MREIRVAWRGLNLNDSIEEEGMTLGARACYRICCEIVSSIRNSIAGFVPEPSQDDSWASFEFANLGQRVRCVVSMQNDNDYSISIYCAQGILRALLGRKAPQIITENIDVVRNALIVNPRFEILRESNAAA